MLGFEQCAFGGNDVAHVPVFECRVYVFAHAFVVDVKLNLTRAILNGGETRFTHHTLEHHAACDGNTDVLRFEFFARGVGVLLLQILGALCRYEIIREGHALLAQSGQFTATLGHNRVFIAFFDHAYGRIGLVFSHFIWSLC